jgi:hypothetical protein
MLSLLTAVVVAAGTAVVVMVGAPISVVAAPISVVAAPIAVVAAPISVVAVHTSGVDAVGPEGSWLGVGQAQPLWLGAQPDLVHVSRPALVHSLVDIAAISGTAVGGITALARAGYGRIITATTCGPVIKVLV